MLSHQTRKTHFEGAIGEYKAREIATADLDACAPSIVDVSCVERSIGPISFFGSEDRGSLHLRKRGSLA